MNHASQVGRKTHRVTCIIPAYNEQERIGAVIASVSSHPLIAQVIVVDDGSTDETARVAGGFKNVEVLRLSRNGGKTRALGAGLARATGEYILLVDADLVGLDANDLTALIEPVLRGDADMSMSFAATRPGCGTGSGSTISRANGLFLPG